MKKYKIGRYWYKELTEEQFNNLTCEEELNTYLLIDSDGEPVKYFIIINKKGGNKK